MDIAARILGPQQPAYIVAEIGNNHDGSFGQAKALIQAAAEAGADAVKFQTHIADAEMLPSTPTPPHFDEPRFAFTRRMELSLDAHLRLKDAADEHGVAFFSSPFSVEAVELLEKVDPVAFKIASGEVTNPPLVEAVARTGKPVFVSTGMSGLEEIAGAVGILRGLGASFVLMQCTSVYPCPPERVNLRAMRTLADHFRCEVGLSDHTPTIHTAIAAVALGAVCIEKHFTLSRRLYGPDHHASLEPADLAELVRGVRQVEAALGDGEKVHDTSLDSVRTTFEKSIVTRVAIPEGVVIEHSMLTTKRPGSGIPARRLGDVVGRRAVRAIPPNELVDEADLG